MTQLPTEMARFATPLRSFSTSTVSQRKKGESTQKIPIYIPCQWSLSRCVCSPKAHPGPDWLRPQLATGKMPLHKYSDSLVKFMISKGKRPRKPRRFEAQGITSEVWKVAEKCWHEKAGERPEARQVLWDLEKIANSGVCTHNACTCSSWEFIDFRSESVAF